MIRWRRAASSLLVVISMAACSSPSRAGWRGAAPAPFVPITGSDAVSVTSLVAGRPWLMVGTETNRAGQQRPRAWSSLDGRSWNEDRVLATTLDGPSDRLIGVAQSGQMVVAAGEYASPTEGNLRPTMWRRDPAGTWHDIDEPRELFGGERAGGVVAVAASPAAFITVGGWTDAHNQPDVGVWRSLDSRTWSRVDGEDALSPNPVEVVVATAATGATGGFVIVGNSLSASSGHGVAWWSPDGLHWSRSAVEGAASLHSVTTTPAGFFAVGLDQTGAASGWQSTDGRRWTTSARLPSGVIASTGTTALMTSAGGAGGDVLAAGILDGRPHLWRDGTDQWHPLSLPSGLAGAPGVTKLLAAGAGSTTVLIADRASGPTLWFSTALR